MGGGVRGGAARGRAPRGDEELRGGTRALPARRAAAAARRVRRPPRRRIGRRAGSAGSLSPGLAQLRLAQGKRDAALAAIRRACAEVTDPLKRAALLPAQIEIALAAGEVEEARTACLELRELAEQYESAMLDAIVAHAARRRRARRGRRAVGAREPAPRAAHLARARRSLRGRAYPRADRPGVLRPRRRRGSHARARGRARAVRAPRSRTRSGADLDPGRRETRAVGARARGPAPRRLGEEQPRDRVGARDQRAHRREAPAEHLREARASPHAPQRRPSRSSTSSSSRAPRGQK